MTSSIRQPAMTVPAGRASGGGAAGLRAGTARGAGGAGGGEGGRAGRGGAAGGGGAGGGVGGAAAGGGGVAGRAGGGVGGAGGGVGGAAAGGGGAAGGGAAARPAAVSSSVVLPTRTVSPTASACRSRIRVPFTNVPLAEPRSSISSRPEASRVTTRVAAGQLRVVAQLPDPALRASDHELVVQDDHLALGPALPHDELLRGHRGQAGRGRGSQLGRRGHPARAVRHRQQRLAEPDHIPGAQRPRAVDPLAVHERPVGRPEVLDR